MSFGRVRLRASQPWQWGPLGGCERTTREEECPTARSVVAGFDRDLPRLVDVGALERAARGERERALPAIVRDALAGRRDNEVAERVRLDLGARAVNEPLHATMISGRLWAWSSLRYVPKT